MFKKIKNQIGKPSTLWKKRDMNSLLDHFDSIDIELAGHCNLNCKSCSHYSPITEKEFLSFEDFERDLTQLSKVLGDYVRGISLLGGEPLLNEEVEKYLIIARKIFPKIKITLLTNGLLLPKQKESFWITCKENNIELEATKYPINFDYSSVVEISESYGVNFSFYGRSRYIQKTQYHLPLDIEGKQDCIKSFEGCFMARECFTLNHGKLFTCSSAAYIERFNKYYGENLKICANDYVDIYTETDAKRIFEKLSRPIPFCRYCDVDNRTYGNKWEVSKKKIEEWI